MKKRLNVKKMVLMAMLAAVAYLLVAVFPKIPVVLFLSYEPKDVVISVGGFLLGPMASFLISLLVALVEMVTVSSTGPIGCLMNLLSSTAFACTAAYVYKHKRSMSGAVLGLAAGSVAMVGIMLLWNWLITPLYMGVPREQVAGLLIPAFLPFNALKAGFNSALTLMLYKPLVAALRKTGLVPSRPGKTAGAKWGIYLLAALLLAALLLATCVLFLLVIRGIL